MSENISANFTYLNQDGLWPNFQLEGLERLEDGSLQLASVPLLLDELPQSIVSATSRRPAGIAMADDGTIFYSQPKQHRILKIDSCAGNLPPSLCLGGKGMRPTQFHSPRGLLLHPTRPALLVADRGNDRIQLFDPHSLQLIDIWGGIRRPGALTADKDGHVYVIEGVRLIKKLDHRGNEEPAFWQRVRVEGTVNRPTAIAALSQKDTSHLFVINTKKVRDIEGPNLVVLDQEGRLAAGPFFLSLTKAERPRSLVVTKTNVYVGCKHLHVYRRSQNNTELEYVGKAFGYEGHIAALTIAPDETLWLLPHGAMVPLRFAKGQAYLTRGILYGGPFSIDDYPVHWRRLQALRQDTNNDAYLQLYTFTSNEKESGPQLPQEETEKFTFSGWQEQQMDVLDALVPREIVEQDKQKILLPAKYIWLGIVFSGNGRSTPILEQIRLKYGQSTYGQHLPAIFSQDRAQRDQLERLLGLFESTFEGIENQIDGLGRYFSPDTVPADWLHWLASWGAVDLDENWSEAQQRETIAQAFARTAHRGTAVGLQQALHLAGIAAHIEEPHLYANWWALAENDQGDGGRLGIDSRLAPVEADGAILGSTATLDRVHLIAADERGAPLFANTAHQFTVQLYRGQVEQLGMLERVRAIVDAEKPAHTAYHICLIEPRMRIGFQARLGIDAIVADPDPAPPLVEVLEGGIRLAGNVPGRIGIDSRIGQTAA